MFVSGINDNNASAIALCEFLKKFHPAKPFLSIPMRPPAEPWVKPPDASALRIFLDTVSECIPCVDLLFDAGIGNFISTGDLASDILTITSVHPLRESAMN